MYTKQEERKNWRETKTSLAKQVNELLFNRKLSIVNAAERTNIPLYIMEKISLGKEVYDNGSLRALANFLDKKIKIELVD